MSHRQGTCTSTPTPASPHRPGPRGEAAAQTEATADAGTSDLPEFAFHHDTEGEPQVITLKDAVDRLTVPQLTDLHSYIANRIAMLEMNSVMADVVADQRQNPVMDALPPCRTEWSPTRIAMHELELEQRAAERANARTQ
jgi:hypothetical protein